MGRVDEAMRRRAAATATVVTDTNWTKRAPALETPVVPELPEEAFEAEPAPISAEPPHVNGVAVKSPVTEGLLVTVPATLSTKLVIDDNMVPASREQYRRLAATLHHAQAASGLRVVMIASAVPGEGKSLTAANLALTLSQSYQRSVLIIDADLRRPSLHTVFGVQGAPGLSEGLMAEDEQKLTVHQISERLSLLPAGAPSADPMAGLTSPRMRRLIDESREAYAWVIVDTPPIGLLPDAGLLGTMVDGTIMVVKAGETPFELVKKAADAIGADGLLGVVLNRADPHARKYAYGYGYYDYRANIPKGK